MKITLVGYGRMGRMIEEVAVSRGHSVVCTVDADNQSEFGGDAFRSADVVVEFTSPESAYSNVIKAFDCGMKVVSGTTGWYDCHRQEIRERCENGATLFWSSNFSVGVYLFSAVNRYLARLMKGFPGYEVSIDEVHHCHKKDAPSGTAVSLAGDIIAAGLKEGYRDFLVTGDGGERPGSDGCGGKLPIFSFRRGEVAGIHTVRYEGDDDIISISHEARSRMGFAVGAVLAAEYTATHSGLLKMSDLFENI